MQATVEYALTNAPLHRDFIFFFLQKRKRRYTRACWKRSPLDIDLPLIMRR